MCVHCFGDQMVSIIPFAAPAASQSETILFGSLEFPAIPRDRSWAPPPFSPSQTFQFGSLEFITDQLGALHLHENETALANTEEPSAPPKPRNLRHRRSVRWRIKKCGPSQPTRAVLPRIALTMASNPAVEDVNLALFSLANVSRPLVLRATSVRLTQRHERLRSGGAQSRSRVPARFTVRGHDGKLP